MNRHRLLALSSLAAALFLAADAPATPPPVSAAGIVVNTLSGVFPPVTDGQCSLYEAILNANTNAAVFPDCAAGTGADSITFTVSGNIDLAPGLPNVTDPAGLLIDGTGKDIHVRGGGFGPQLSVLAGAVAEVKALTFELNPLGPDTERAGGGLNNAGTLTLDTVIVRNNVAYRGAGIFNTGTLVVKSSTVADNIGGIQGGGLWNGGTMAVQSSTISGNTGVNIGGAGVWNQGRTAMANSTVSGNKASSTLENVPAVPGTHASGADITNIDGGSFVIANSTITNNRVAFCTFPCSSGPAGIRNAFNATGVALINSVVADNVALGSGPGTATVILRSLVRT